MIYVVMPQFKPKEYVYKNYNYTITDGVAVKDEPTSH